MGDAVCCKRLPQGSQHRSKPHLAGGEGIGAVEAAGRRAGAGDVAEDARHAHQLLPAAQLIGTGLRGLAGGGAGGQGLQAARQACARTRWGS